MPKRVTPVPQRLPETMSPALDRSRTVTISFDGEPIEAYAGDTVGSAVYGSGVRLFSRSFKYHRPRGLLCCSGACPNCLVTVDGTPNERACTTPVIEGMRVEAQNAFPSLDFDLLSIVDKLGRFLPVGFYYKTLMYPRSFWPLYETVLRHIAGLGRVDFQKDPHARYVHRHLSPDVAVIGGGPAGLSAAIAAAQEGLRVVVVDENPKLGGHLLGETRIYDDAGEFSGQRGHDIALELARRLEKLPNVEILTGAVAFGFYEGNLVAVAQGDTLIELRAGSYVIATGISDHPLVFENNDLPGVMLGSGVQRLLRLWAVIPARRAVVVSAHDEGLRVALDLLNAGVTVAAVAEHRTEIPDSPELRTLIEANIQVLRGWSVAEAVGKSEVKEAILVRLDAAGKPIRGTERTEACSLLVMSSGLETNASLLWQAGCTVTYDENLDLFTPRTLAAGVYAAGEVTGVRSLPAALLGGTLAGADAARRGDLRSPPALDTMRAQLKDLEQRFRERTTIRSIAPIEDAGPNRHRGRQARKFVCPCEDVTLKDIDQAVREGFDHIETLKRYSTVTMGPCQGKMCAMNAVAACAHATGRTIAETGTTTSRPLVQPVALGTIAGPHLEPTRLTPLHYRHLEAGAEMMDAGQWKRPRVYTSVEDEVRAVRERVGLIDVSTLGKIDLQGRDSVVLLERIYTNKWADLPVGRVRYGMMVDESGIIMDDGTVARLGEDRFFVTTTSSGVGAVEEWLTWWMEGTEMCAHVTNLTSGFAALNLAGPASRDVLAKVTDLDISARGLPYLRAAEGDVAGIPAVILRIGFVGELGYEMHVPAEYGEYLWDILMEAGKEFGIVPFGVEAQRTLRLEKGHIIVTQDTDALSTPLEANMSWAVKFDKGDFIGKTSLSHLRDEGLSQALVGFQMPASPVTGRLDTSRIPDEGAQIVRQDGYPVGRVTSARYSPALGMVIGLAWVPSALSKEGSELRVQLNGHTESARVVPIPFYDASGARMKS
ncbi:MAG: 2Fe-2S iron-sulfur cluster-binding protein [Chloroflexota bacterium]|nr:2Fe-2S iron-sulfur cluster-binding protein [Chloroflexota bacterium]